MTKAPFIDQDIPIGTKWILRRPRYTRDYEVIDIHKTYNHAGDLIKTRYVCKSELSIDYDVVKVTIQKALMQRS